jgi:hypothetical protein
MLWECKICWSSCCYSITFLEMRNNSYKEQNFQFQVYSSFLQSSVEQKKICLNGCVVIFNLLWNKNSDLMVCVFWVIFNLSACSGIINFSKIHEFAAAG